MSTPVIKTAAGCEFHHTGDASPHRRLFTVTAGIPLLDALQSVSDLLSTIEEPINDAAMGIKALEHSAAWRVEYVLECAKAVIDSLIEGIEYPDQPTAQRVPE